MLVALLAGCTGLRHLPDLPPLPYTLPLPDPPPSSYVYLADYDVSVSLPRKHEIEPLDERSARITMGECVVTIVRGGIAPPGAFRVTIFEDEKLSVHYWLRRASATSYSRVDADAGGEPVTCWFEEGREWSGCARSMCRSFRPYPIE